MSQCYRVGQFLIGKKLGEGACGKVYLGFHESTGVKVAIKMIDKQRIMKKPEMKKKVEREIAFMKIVHHDNILKLYTVYETSKYLFIIMELCEGGELFDYIADKGHLETDEVLKYFQQLIFAVEHIHSRRICHHDLKPENLLLTKNKQMIKLCDFGMSIYCGSNKLRDFCGSPHYTAPEIFKKQSYDGLISDIWSCGVILYVMTFGLMPFDDDNLDGLMEKVSIGEYVFPEQEVDPNIKDLIQKMLEVDPTKRITLKDIKQHPFFQMNHPDIFEIPPIVEQAGEPIQNIDSNIMSILCYLLNNVHITEVRQNLMKKEPNTIRAFYRLLEQHRKNSKVDPFVFTRNSPGPQSMKSTIFAIPETNSRDDPLSLSFNELRDRPKNTYNYVKTPSPAPQPIPINSPSSPLLHSGSPLNFSVPIQSDWGFMTNHNVSTTNNIELDCCLNIAIGKLEKCFHELNIKMKKFERRYECEYQYFEDEEASVYFDIVVEEGEINEMTRGFGDRTVIQFFYCKGDVMSFTDVCELITQLVTDVDY